MTKYINGEIMEEISKLFETNEMKKIKVLLEKIIKKIEKEERHKQNLLLEELVEKAQLANEKLREKYQVIECLCVYPESISPLALIAEEITMDAQNGEDMLEILKLNLNNYFKQFKEPKSDDIYIDLETLKQVLKILKLECDFFEILKKYDIKLSIMLLPFRYKKINTGVLNYNEIINKNFAIHCYRGIQLQDKNVELFEECLNQFGVLLKNILVGTSKKAPDGFLEIFEDLEETVEIDEESKELTALFANTFSHYIIEKMERRVITKIGKGWKEKSGNRNEAFVEKMMQYFDKIFDKLLKESEKTEFVKSIPIHPEVDSIFYDEQVRFKKIFGRTPDENHFVCGGVLLRDLKREMKLIKRNDIIDKAWLYAYEQTGMMLTEENKDMFSERDIKEFSKFIDEFQRKMKGKVKGGKWNILQASEATNFLLEEILEEKIEDMIYVLNLFVNYYSPNNQNGKDFIIHNIKDFLVFCAYKTSINLSALNSLVEKQYYDSSMAVIRILFEILINVRAYKNDPELFQKKILPLVGVGQGTHRKLDKNFIENLETKETYKFKIQKSQLAEKAGSNYKKIYDKYYDELSEFIHLDTSSAQKIFSYNDLFLELDECLMARFVGMIFALEIIMELIDFEGNDYKISKDIIYFSNMVHKMFLDILPTIISIEDKEIYHILEDTLKDYKTDYKINYQRTRKWEIC